MKKNIKNNKIIISYIFLIIILKLISNTIDIKMNNKLKDKYKEYELFDIIHSITPNFHKITIFFYIVQLFLFLFIFFNKKIDKKKYLEKVFKIELFNFIITYCTVLPSNKYCKSSLIHNCHNYIFSTNIAYVLLNSLYIYEKYPYILIYLLLFIFIYSILLISSRINYTIDVILGIYAAYNIYYE